MHMPQSLPTLLGLLRQLPAPRCAACPAQACYPLKALATLLPPYTMASHCHTVAAWWQQYHTSALAGRKDCRRRLLLLLLMVLLLAMAVASLLLALYCGHCWGQERPVRGR